MNILIDTHVYLWWLDQPTKISKAAHSVIENVKNTVFVSAAVPWEITIKKSIGKLDVTNDVMDYMIKDEFLPLSIDHAHSLALKRLPAHHHDPFDRIQIAQAWIEDLTFITRDKNILKYDLIKTIKA